MPEPPTLDPAVHRRLAVDLFNFVWTLLDKPERTPDEADSMLHAAHASRYHWGLVGQPVNLARGEWQCSRVYSALGRAEPARWHGRRCLEVCRRHAIGDFDLAYAYEALARAESVAGDLGEVARWMALARDAAAQIAEEHDRRQFASDLASIPTGVAPQARPMATT
jgi:hypothetical protein